MENNFIETFSFKKFNIILLILMTSVIKVFLRSFSNMISQNLFVGAWRWLWAFKKYISFLNHKCL